MRTVWSWSGLVGLAAIAAGCAQSPSPSAPAAGYGVQAATLEWSSGRQGGGWGGLPWVQERPATTPRTSGGWGQEYPWRGPGPQPAWYGVHPHVADRLVLIAPYYYPYYFEGGQIYPVYSMPHTLEGDRFKPRYGPLPAFGPAVVAPASARLFRHHRGLLVDMPRRLD